MLKKAVKLLRGSVCVRAKSAYPERMLNLCSARGIEFWDVRWIDDTALSFCVARGDLRALRRDLAQEAGVPPWLRDDLPLLWVDGRLAWIAGVGVAAEFRCRPGESGVLPDWSALAG